MTAEEIFAIKQTIEIIRMKVRDAFSHVRSDTRGHFQRQKRDAIMIELGKLESFVESFPCGNPSEGK